MAMRADLSRASSIPQKDVKVGQFLANSTGGLLSLTRDELAGELEELGEPSFRAAQLCGWIYERRARTFEEMTDLPAAFAGGFLRALRIATANESQGNGFGRYDTKVPVSSA